MKALLTVFGGMTLIGGGWLLAAFWWGEPTFAGSQGPRGASEPGRANVAQLADDSPHSTRDIAPQPQTSVISAESAAIANDSPKLPTAQKSTTAVPIVQPVPKRYPEHVSAYDFMTAEDEFYLHHLDRLCYGNDIAEWPLVKSLVGLGANAIDGFALASLANQTIHVSDQPRAEPIIQMTRECADILGVQPPRVFIEGNPFPNAYVTGLQEPHILVITSGLLNLMDESPDELRFVIAHELGHIKAQHIRSLLIGRFIFGAVIGKSAQSQTTIGDVGAVATFGTLMHWVREAEYTADRAGLICLGGDVKTARQALMRLMHQTKPSHRLLTPGEEFDASKVIDASRRLRDLPFVDLLSYLRQFSATHPFIPDRGTALETWDSSGEYQALLDRQSADYSNKVLVVTRLEVHGIPRVDIAVPWIDSGDADPFVRVKYAGNTHSLPRLTDTSDAVWDKQELRFPLESGAGLLIDLIDYNLSLGDYRIGTCRLPAVTPKSGNSGVLQGTVCLDLERPSTLVQLPTVRLEYRIEDRR